MCPNSQDLMASLAIFGIFLKATIGGNKEILWESQLFFFKPNLLALMIAEESLKG